MTALPAPAAPETPSQAFPRPGAKAARRISPACQIASSLGLLVVVGFLDEVTGTEVSLILFYLVPIALGTWFASRAAGFLLSAVGAAVSVAAEASYRFGAGRDVHLGVLAWNGFVQLGTSVALVLMLAALRSRLEVEELLARTDALTRIANRRAFFEAAAHEIQRARRHGRPLTVAYVDLDDFKNVNDQLGHAQGDTLLLAVAQTLRAGTRSVDSVARLGGDEFGLLLPETDAGEAEAILARLRAAVLSAMVRGGWRVGVSMGAATFLSPPESIDEMMARADDLMYAAKREQKGTVRLGIFPGPERVPGPRAALTH